MLIQIEDNDHEEKLNNSNNHFDLTVGIDFGTTNTVISTAQDGVPTVICDDLGPLFVESVFVDETNNEIIKYPKNMMDFPDKVMSFGLTPIFCATIILSNLKKRLDKFFKQNVEKAVITVPAYFSEIARQATKQAATMAGFKVLRLINEPTAAALIYGLDKQKKGNYLIYDFGGGTFDVSILNFQEGVFKVLATAGDTNLGGNNIDETILDYMKWEKNPDNIHKTKLLKESPNDFLTAENLNFLSRPFVEKTILLCEQAIKASNLNKEQIKGIVLVGGSSRLTTVKEQLKASFSMEIFDDIDPDKAVSYGAAIQADQLANRNHTLLIDVNPIAVGIEIMGGIFERIIERNTPVPISISQDFTTSVDGQSSIIINIYQGERELVKDCLLIGSFVLKDILPMLAGTPKIRVNFNLDVDGLLTVSAKDMNNNQSFQSVEINPVYNLTLDDCASIIKDSFNNFKDDIAKKQEITTLEKANSLYKQLNIALKKDAHLITKKYYEDLLDLLDKLNKAVVNQKIDLLNNLIEEINKFSQDFAQKRIEDALKNSKIQDNY